MIARANERNVGGGDRALWKCRGGRPFLNESAKRILRRLIKINLFN